VITRPFSVTSSATPSFEWNASTDTGGSGIKGYLVTIRRADGSVAGFQTTTATSIPSPATLTDGETYTVVVTAVDNTVDPAWTTDSDTLTFRVDSQAGASSFTPAGGTILSGSAKSGTFTISLDRAANQGTVSASTVQLRRGDGVTPSYSAKCSNTPCTVITVDPSSSLGEGKYVLSLNGVKSADEGLTFAGSASYAVPYTESGSIPAPILCGNASAPSAPFPVTAAPAGQTAFLDFDISFSNAPGGWTIDAYRDAVKIATQSGSGAGHFRIDFPSSDAGNLTFKLTATCPGNVSASNLFGSRYP
jgi:hypothetical protein